MDCNAAFKQLKHALVYTPVLDMPSFNANFVLDTDASDIAIGIVLMQYDQPVAFILKCSSLHKGNTIAEIMKS